MYNWRTCPVLSWIFIKNAKKIMDKNAQERYALHWNRLTCDAIYYTKMPPTQAARALAMVHTAMYDAWTVFSGGCEFSTTTGGRFKRAEADCSAKSRKIAISYAAFRVLESLFEANLPEDHRQIFADFMGVLGCDPGDHSLDVHKPQGIGNLSAKLIIECRLGDGSNQGNKYADYSGYKPENAPPPVKPMKNIAKWQPQLTNSKNPQAFLTPHWGLVKPFGLKWGGQFRPSAPAAMGSYKYEHQVKEMVNISACLTDEQKLIAEYWAGMHEDKFEDAAFLPDHGYWTVPPSQCCRIVRYLARKEDFKTAAVIKVFFALSNALLDASIAAWDCKVHYDYGRPDSVIHELYDEKVFESWGGPCRGTVSMEGEGWCPYLITTPPFAEYVSGHSTFSRAMAEIINYFCGSNDYGESLIIPAKGSRIEPECTPSEEVTLYWDNLLEAANQAGNSRRYGGIHFEEGDLKGRELGKKVAECVWHKVQWYLNGGVPGNH
jgi:hypothetical protein